MTPDAGHQMMMFARNAVFPAIMFRGIAVISLSFFLIGPQKSLAVHFGEVVSPEKFPCVGQVSYPVEGGMTFGTGTLIAPDLVLTAAHVVIGAKTPYHISFRLDALPKTEFHAVAYRIHPEYYSYVAKNTSTQGLDSSSWANDIALVRLDRPVKEVNEFFELATTVPSRSVVATLVGFGADENKKAGQRRSGKLKYIAPRHGYLLFGAGGDRFQKSDHGDSGGPLIIQSGSKTQIVATVRGHYVDRGELKQLVADEYGLYVSIASHLNWIERMRIELTNVQTGVKDVFAIRKAGDTDPLPALSMTQFQAMVQADMPPDRLLPRILRRGASEPIPEDLAKVFLKLGYPNDGFFVVDRRPDAGKPRP